MKPSQALSPQADPDWYETIRISMDEVEAFTPDIFVMHLAASPNYQPVEVMWFNQDQSFPNLTIWLLQIADKSLSNAQLPARLVVREGDLEFEVSALPNDRLDFAIRATTDSHPQPTDLLRAVVRRKQFVSEFAKTLRGFARDTYIFPYWNTSSEQLKTETDAIMLALRRSQK